MMKLLFNNIKLQVPQKVFLKDPETSSLGKRILTHSILLIDDMGFEAFTFKKLGDCINSNESSIYRYFENKHKLLLYLTSWYWAWLEYQLVFETHNITDPKTKLLKAIEVVTKSVEEDSNFSHINEIALHRIIINENSKSFLTKSVDQENKDGVFNIYKNLVLRIKDMVHELNPKFSYAESLSSSIVEGALHQHFLREHFPSITNVKPNGAPIEFYQHMALTILTSK